MHFKVQTEHDEAGVIICKLRKKYEKKALKELKNWQKKCYG